MLPVVSIIIPTYQCGHLLLRAVDSALAQTYPNVEIVVINDGSTDNTDEVIQPYLDRLKYIKQCNQGLAGARNTGIRQASGEYVALLDADDYYLPDRLAAVMEVFAYDRNCFVTTDYYIEIEGRKTHARGYGGLDSRFQLDAGGQLAMIFLRNFIFGQVVIPRAILDEVGLFDETLLYAEDWDLWVRCLAAGYRAVLVPEPLGVYMVNRLGSLTRQYPLQKAKASLRILAKHKKAISPSVFINAKGTIFWHTLRESLAGGNYILTLVVALRFFMAPLCWRNVFIPNFLRGLRRLITGGKQ